jgi:hypothetical protein
VAKYGQEWIRTTEGISQQIYSLPRLATSVPTRDRTRGFAVAVLRLRLNSPPGTARAANFASCLYRTPPSALQEVFRSHYRRAKAQICVSKFLHSQRLHWRCWRYVRQILLSFLCAAAKSGSRIQVRARIHSPGVVPLFSVGRMSNKPSRVRRQLGKCSLSGRRKRDEGYRMQ